MSVAIPTDELSIDSVKGMKNKARYALIEMMKRSGKAIASNQVTVRAAEANTDCGVTNGTDTDEWTTGALTAGTDYVYVNSQLGNNKYVVFYGVTIRGAFVRPPVIGSLFKIGANGANVMGDFDFQDGFGYEHFSWFFDNPIVYQPTDLMYIQLKVAVSQVANALQVTLRGLVSEPAGQSVM